MATQSEQAKLVRKTVNEIDTRLENISSEEFKDSILKSEEKLMEEYFKIDQIRMESFKNAMNEQIIYI